MMLLRVLCGRRRLLSAFGVPLAVVTMLGALLVVSVNAGAWGAQAVIGNDTAPELRGAVGDVLIRLEPAHALVVKDDIFTMDIKIDAGDQPVDSAEVHLAFDPLYLRVVDASGNPADAIMFGSVLDVPFLNRASNDRGEIDYAAGTFSSRPPTGTFVLATIRFKALWGTADRSSPVTFVETRVAYEGALVAHAVENGSVTTSGPIPVISPTNGMIDPSSGSGPAGVTTHFTTTWSDGNGWQDLKQCYFHIGATSSVHKSVALLYNRLKNKLWIRSDDGTQWLGGFAPRSDNVLENGQAKVYCRRTRVRGSGDTLGVRWAIVFKPAFRGEKEAYLDCRDLAGARAEGAWKGTWTIE